MSSTESLWMATAKGRSYPALSGEISADVVVIGGGIAGIVAAWQLEQERLKVVVLEADEICASVTAYTTAKVTSGHGAIYDRLLSKVGQESALAYADANQWGVEWIASTVDELGIECDFGRRDMSVFAESEEERHTLEAEFETAQKLGLPVAWFHNADLPVRNLGSICYHNQAQFHPRRFVLGLAERLQGEIYEHTRVTEVKEERNCTVITDSGKVTARFIVVASHFPAYDPAMFFARLAPYRDYAVAAKLHGDVPQQMSIGCGKQAKAFRTHPQSDGDLLIVSGETHRVGQADTQACFDNLERYLREHFEVESIAFAWSTQDNSTLDGMPYIGRIKSGTEHVFVITGFNSWGMSTSAYAGKIIADLVTMRSNPWADAFAPGRFKGLESFKTLASENANVAKHLVGGRLHEVAERELTPGEGAIVKMGGEKVAAYCDPEGAMYTLSPSCTHMGCIVTWNSAEKSWDCPCHGSRFNFDGTVIQGPANKNLEKKTVSARHGPKLM